MDTKQNPVRPRFNFWHNKKLTTSYWLCVGENVIYSLEIFFIRVNCECGLSTSINLQNIRSLVFILCSVVWYLSYTQ